MSESKQKITLLSNRATNVKDSITMAISAQAKKMKKEGKDVLGFSAGEPDFDTPESIKQAGIQAIQDGKTRYTPASGIAELKDAICKKLKRDQDVTYSPENIVISCGAKHSIYNTLAAMINPGDEVIIPTPYWVSYPDQVQLCDGTPVLIETSDQSQFKITPDQLKAAITPRTKLLILNTPSNPTGAIYTKEELQALESILEETGIYVLSDEIYEKLVYGNAEHTSIVTACPNLKDQIIVVNGVSKAYAMTGWRIGYIAAPEALAKAIGKIQSQSTSNPCAPAQWASVEAIENGDKDIPPMKTAFNERREYIAQALNNIEGIQCTTPEGAFYVFPNISGLYGKTYQGTLISNSVEFCAALLDAKGVACVPGAGFGADDYIRLSYATDLETIKDGVSRINNFVSTLSD